MFETLTNRLFDILLTGAAAVWFSAFVFTRSDVVQAVIASETRDVETAFVVSCTPNLAGRIRCLIADDRAAVTKAEHPADRRPDTRNPAVERKSHD
tara:strand:- start:6908 stop:7195 length:288 start_codon:yes stop_codon:yes gene_type:complete